MDKVTILSDEQQARLVDGIIGKWDEHLGRFFGTERIGESLMGFALERVVRNLSSPGGFFMNTMGESRLQPFLDSLIKRVKT